MNVLLRTLVREVLGAPLNAAAAGGAAGNTYGDAQRTAHDHGSTIVDDEADRRAAAQGRPRAACCLVLSDDGYVLAVSRKDDPSAFGLPGGKVDPGESPMQAAARELKEETGLDAVKLRLVFVRSEDDGYVTSTFMCTVTGEIDTPESGVIRWVKPEVLFRGPFGRYNEALWERLGLAR